MSQGSRHTVRRGPSVGIVIAAENRSIGQDPVWNRVDVTWEINLVERAVPGQQIPVVTQC